MLDKILGKKDKDKNDTPDLRKNGKKPDSDNSDIGGRLKDMVGKVSGNKPKDDDTKLSKSDSKLDSPSKPKIVSKKPAAERKMPRPIGKPTSKPLDSKPRLRTPEKKKPGGLAGIGGGFGKKLPEDDQRTLVGAAVFGIILIILVGAGYYFLVYGPYQDTLNSAKMAKINEVNSYFKGALSADPHKTVLLADIDSGQTPDQVLAVDVIGPATSAWRDYQNQQINLKKDPYNRVQISYSVPSQGGTGTNGTAASTSTTTAAAGTSSANNVKNLILNTTAAGIIVNEADASVLANMDIVTPDTVAIPVYISRIQAAGGLINVGDSVDVYQNVNTSAQPSSGNNTTQAQPATTTTSSPEISGATVLAILRDTSNGVYTTADANLTHQQQFSVNGAGVSTVTSQSAQGNVEALLKAGASRNWNEAQITSLLNAYGWRLSDFERVSNLGDLTNNYLVVLEVPRENALWVIQNDNVAAGSSLYLVVPTQRAPEWMITELHQIYGS
jgi:hypothetical protein